MAAAISLDEARRRLLPRIPAVAGAGPVLPLSEAAGRVLGCDATAPGDLPPFDRSLVDGAAVRCGGGDLLPVAFEVAMGAAAPPLPDGAAAMVPTGGMIPAGADAVVMQEDLVRTGDRVEVRRAPAPGQNVVRRGADARAGDVVLPAGRRLNPAEVAMLATVGLGRAQVRPRPGVAVLSTGDELVPAGAPAAAGQVPDSNGPALCAALARDGAAPDYLGIAGDDRDAVVRAVRGALDTHQVLLCSGGSSVGDRDFVQGALAEVLGPPLFSGLAIRPGRPTAAFVAGGRWAVALPGHAVSALVVYELLVREAVLRCGGERAPGPRGTVAARLAAEVRAPGDRDLFARVRLQDGVAVPLRGPSAVIGNLARASGLVRCPAGGALAAGAVVGVLLLD